VRPSLSCARRGRSNERISKRQAAQRAVERSTAGSLAAVTLNKTLGQSARTLACKLRDVRKKPAPPEPFLQRRRRSRPRLDGPPPHRRPASQADEVGRVEMELRPAITANGLTS